VGGYGRIILILILKEQFVRAWIQFHWRRTRPRDGILKNGDEISRSIKGLELLD
jgi:hypothetical protein